MFMLQKSFFAIFNILVIGMFVMAATPTESAQPQQAVKEVSMDSLLGFKDWKQKRVFKARASLDQFKTQQTDPNEAVGGAPEAEKQASEKTDENQKTVQNQKDKEAGERLRQLEFNLEIALGLTIHDYFALYLKNKSKEDMVKAVQKLSPEEVSELMLAYKNALYGAPKVEAKAAQNPENQRL
ncbi:MAG: hypothetical protein HRT44_05855 [Bdellovibrionales bacterium]|nr:hypothetical protein [Bdellovibrionales bacterium]NQZ18769.1 hypothetical protein [Bdellovibrionales bacterium]